MKISNALQMKCTVYLVLGQKWSFTICKLMTKNGSVLLISIGLRCSVRQFRPLRRHSALGIENKRSFSLFYSEDFLGFSGRQTENKQQRMWYVGSLSAQTLQTPIMMLHMAWVCRIICIITDLKLIPQCSRVLFFTIENQQLCVTEREMCER